MSLYPGELVIDDSHESYVQVTDTPGLSRGLIPRDYSAYPEDFLNPPAAIPLIPRSEWSARIKEKEERKSRLSDIRGTIASYNQNGHGYCWAYSTVACATIDRALKNQPFVPLSAHAVAAIIKGGRDEGGWCGLSAKFLTEVGVPNWSFWPQGSRDLRLDTPAMRENARWHRTTEGWHDFSRPLWGQELTFDQVATLLLSNVPCALDFNWWGHSVCGLDLVEVERGSFGIRIWNSWGDGWGARGMSVLQGNRTIPNGAIAITSTIPSVV